MELAAGHNRICVAAVLWVTLPSGMMSQERTNQQWIEDLSSEGASRNAALEDLMNRLARVLRSSLGSREEFIDMMVDDMVQDSVIRILASLREYQHRSEFLTWATAVAIRVGMTELRKRRWKDVSLDALVADANIEPTRVESGLASLEARELVSAMYRVIRSELTERQRTVLLAEMKGMAQEEISRQLGCNRNALYKLSHDARQRLKQGLASAGFDEASFIAAFR